jgi:hypothetical protein
VRDGGITLARLLCQQRESQVGAVHCSQSSGTTTDSGTTQRSGTPVESETISYDPCHVAVVIPALNEAESLDALLPLLTSQGLGQVLVCDNGSNDATRNVTEAHGAQWVHEPRRGYGAACYAGLLRLAPSSEIVAFTDADMSDDPALLPALVEPIADGECDLVLGARVADRRETGSTTFAQRFAALHWKRWTCRTGRSAGRSRCRFARWRWVCASARFPFPIERGAAAQARSAGRSEVSSGPLTGSLGRARGCG